MPPKLLPTLQAAPKSPGTFRPDPNAKDRPDMLSIPMDVIKGLLGMDANSTGRMQNGQPAQLSAPNAAAQVLSAGIPILGKIKRGNFLHSLEDIQKIAAGQGEVPLYHGTTNDIASQIMQQGINLPANGEEAAQNVAKTYDIPWSEWKHKVEPQGVGSNYGEATKRLSTAPYPVAERWGSGTFPQGEIYSDLNAKARMHKAAKTAGADPDEFYNQAADIADKQGVRSMYSIPDVIGAEDRMAPKQPGGKIFRAIVDVRAISNRIKGDAIKILHLIKSGELAPEQAVQYWNSTYKDIKIAPQNVKRFELIGDE